MSKKRVIVGTIGTSILLIVLVALLYDSYGPKKVSYEIARYGPPIGRRIYFTPLWRVLFPYVILALLLILLWLVVWRKKSGQPFRTLPKKIGRELWSHAYMVAALLTGVFLFFALFAWQFGGYEPSFQTLTGYYETVPALGQGSDYFANAEITGPEEIRFGTSSVIILKVWIDRGVAPSEDVRLAPDKSYQAKATIQAVNFDIGEDPSLQSGQQLTLNQPALWSWVLSPKEKRLGKQHVVVSIYLTDEEGLQVPNFAYLILGIDVRDPIGLPGSVVYGAVALGGVLGLPFWSWIFDEWRTRRKRAKISRHEKTWNRDH
ncbi:MAG: hypothetical protein AYK19_12290 [Theionarchaea archaeon DG-70-1]|nr:MAG: hypothetical protein AYK19_12290 [Theionarchaea archaeon DG-70-1]